jgi:hypothetical protein
MENRGVLNQSMVLEPDAKRHADLITKYAIPDINTFAILASAHTSQKETSVHYGAFAITASGTSERNF